MINDISNAYDRLMQYPEGSAAPPVTELLPLLNAAVGQLDQRPIDDLRELRQRVSQITPTEAWHRGVEQWNTWGGRFLSFAKNHSTLASIIQTVSFGAFNQNAQPSNEMLLVAALDQFDQRIRDREAYHDELTHDVGQWDLLSQDEQTTVCTGIIREPHLEKLQHEVLSMLWEEIAEPDAWRDEERFEHLKTLLELFEATELIESLERRCKVFQVISNWDEASLLERFEQVSILRQDEPLLLNLAAQLKEVLGTELERKDSLLLTYVELAQQSGIMDDELQRLKDNLSSVYLGEDAWWDSGLLEPLSKSLGVYDVYTDHVLIRSSIADWNSIDYEMRLQLLRALVATHGHFEKDFDRVRRLIFSAVPHCLNFGRETLLYHIRCVKMLVPACPKGAAVELCRLRALVLEAVIDRELYSFKGRHETLEMACRLLDISEDVIAFYNARHGVKGLGKRIKRFITGKPVGRHSFEERVRFEVSEIRLALRRMGGSTPLGDFPEVDQVHRAQLRPEHLQVTASEIPEYTGEARLADLIQLLWAGELQGYFSPRLEEVEGGGQYTSSQLIGAVEDFIKGIEQRRNGPTSRTMLLHYTDSVLRRLDEADEDELEELYLELEHLVLECIGFSTHHCQDRQYTAVRQVFTEKVATSMDSESLDIRLCRWVARRRDQMVTQLLIEMLADQELYVDIASACTYWRYELREQFGLGNVAPSAFSLDGYLDRAEILGRFAERYTAERILDWCMEAHQEGGGGNKELSINSIHDLLDSRFTDYREFRWDMLDEDCSNLNREGMAIYLRECGVIRF